MSSVFTLEEVKKHNNQNSCWIVLFNKVYDVTKFLSDHPGGRKVILRVAGTDASEQFETFHDVQNTLSKFGPELQIGVIGSNNENEDSSESQSLLTQKWGEDIPYAEPYWYQNFKSPFYKETHAKYRILVRNFVENNIKPYIDEWEEAHDYPRELHQQAYEAGIYGSLFPEEYGGTPPEDYDYFHELIFWDEITRCGSGGLTAACFFTLTIALPPILAVGSDYIKNKVAKPCITGEKIIALAVTEPYAGSDVANIQTTAKLIDDEYYLVNGEKKFITSGCKADFFTVAVRTGGKGLSGISILLMEKGMKGFGVRRMKTQGWWCSNTAYLTFDNVKVPKKNLVGMENAGFLAIMLNFNHERFAGCCMGIRGARSMIEQSIKYARIRKTFGKRLIDHQVIRHKIAEMVRRVESTQAYLEQLTFQLANNVDDFKLGGHFALLKVQCTKVLEFCCREAFQIFGGAAYLREGKGRIVERAYREVRVAAIGGGSEEILMDLAMRQAKL